VRFADGRPFHSSILSSGEADIAHHCADDRYLGRYRVADVDVHRSLAGHRAA